MKLLSSPASPFGAKVKMWAHRVGLFEYLTIEPVDTLGLAAQGHHPNPLGKIPCLVLDDGLSIFDSQVICEYLAQRAQHTHLMPQTIEDKTLFAAINGVTEAALLVVYEGRMRESHQMSDRWLAMQNQKINDGLVWLSQRLPDMQTMNGIAFAAALSYLDLRMGPQWRTTHPDCAAWLSQFSSTHSWFETAKPH
ncbi:MAG: glutathione S-transferase family protein [Litorivicinus sp.]